VVRVLICADMEGATGVTFRVVTPVASGSVEKIYG
jgi:hypothetical protein